MHFLTDCRVEPKSQYRVNGSKETAYERDDSDSPGDYPLGHFEQLIADRNSSLLQWRFRDYCRKQLGLCRRSRRAGSGCGARPVELHGLKSDAFTANVFANNRL